MFLPRLGGQKVSLAGGQRHVQIWAGVYRGEYGWGRADAGAVVWSAGPVLAKVRQTPKREEGGGGQRHEQMSAGV